MTIPISREPDSEPAMERCCFCRVRTKMWTALPSRSLGAQVACCDSCADVRRPSEVPTKAAWCDKEAALMGRARRTPGDLTPGPIGILAPGVVNISAANAAFAKENMMEVARSVASAADVPIEAVSVGVSGVGFWDISIAARELCSGVPICSKRITGQGRTFQTAAAMVIDRYRAGLAAGRIVPIV